jgi:hypothetical protein
MSSIRTPKDAERLLKKLKKPPFIGKNEQCASLTKELTGAPPASLWKPGEKVQGASIPIGAAIATFNFLGLVGTNGYGPPPPPPKNPGGKSGVSHTGIYLGQDARGITILHQAKGLRPIISVIPWEPWWYPKGYKGSPWESGNKYYVLSKED